MDEQRREGIAEMADLGRRMMATARQATIPAGTADDFRAAGHRVVDHGDGSATLTLDESRLVWLDGVEVSFACESASSPVARRAGWCGPRPGRRRSSGGRAR